MSKKSRKRNKRILALAGAIGLGMAAKRKRNAAIDTGIASAEADKDSAMLADSKKKSTPIAPIGPRSVNVATPPKRSNVSISKRSSRGVGDYPDYTAAPTRVNGVQIKGRLNAQPTTPFSPAQGNRKKTMAEVLSGGDTRNYKSGGRTGYNSGGAAKRGVSPILLKGKR